MKYKSTIHPISWFRDRYNEGDLVIKPPYQRKPVWTERQKCYLIETILLELPIPEIFVQQITTAAGLTTYAIVDGQQRIRAILQFLGSEIEPDEEEHNKFSLDKLDSTSEWRNLKFSELDENVKIEFFEYSISVRYLRTDSDDAVRDMFRRLNKYLSPLKPQELRNATYAGPFLRLAERLANDEYWAENRIVTPVSIRRQGDVEFVSELLIGVLHGPQGGSSRTIDEYYSNYEDYDDEFPEQRIVRRLYGQSMEVIQRVLPSIKKLRWSNKTDFYTLFVAIASLLREKRDILGSIRNIRAELETFAEEVAIRLGDEEATVSSNAVAYVRAVEKGANDKKRRADRHLVMRNILDPYFRERKR